MNKTAVLWAKDAPVSPTLLDRHIEQLQDELDKLHQERESLCLKDKELQRRIDDLIWLIHRFKEL